MVISNPKNDFLAKDMIAISGVILASVAFVTELTLLPLVLNAIQEDLGFSVTELSWVFNAYAIAIAVAVLVTGLIGDRIEKYRIFFFGLLLFLAGSLLSALSGSFDFLVFSRTLQGLGGGLFSPLVPILLARAFPETPGKILIIWGGFAGVVATLMPFVVIGFLSLFGWRGNFYLISSIALFSFLVSIRFSQRNDIENSKTNFDIYRLFKIPEIWYLFSYIFFTYGCFTYFLFYFPLFISEFEYSARFVALFLACMWFSFSVASYILRNDIDGRNLRMILSVAPVFFASGYVMGILFPDIGVALLVAALLVGIGFACCNAPSTHLLLKLAPEDIHVFSASLDIVLARFGGVVAVALLSGVVPVVAGGSAVMMAMLALVSCRLCFSHIKEEQSSPA